VDTTVDALVDSESAHSISMAVMSCLHLLSLHRPDLHVMVTNGNRVASTNICKDVHFFIGNEEFVIDFFVIPLAGYDMVLGVQWLCMPGPFLWDFECEHELLA
jgi:hypothetical protein